MPSVTVPLSSPVQAMGEELHALHLREPNGGDIAACGYPFRIGMNEADQALIINANEITALIARLGNVPLSAARNLNLRDWNECMRVVMGFFHGPEEETANPPGPILNGSSTDTSISHGTGSPTPATSLPSALRN